MRERIGWASVPLREVAEINPRKSVDLEMTDAVTFVPMAAVDEVSGTITDRVERPLREVRSGFTQFRENDVIVAKITPSMENGKAAIATDLANGVGFGSTEFHVIRSKGALLPDFIWRFVRQRSFRDEAQKVMSGAVGQQRVPAEFLKSYMAPLPPLAEQRRIVDKSNALIARTSRATAELAQIPMLIARYRSIVLDLAFSGRLTRDLRNQNHPSAGGLEHSRAWRDQRDPRRNSGRPTTKSRRGSGRGPVSSGGQRSEGVAQTR